jgi:flagellar hook-associated protein 1 FlgK
MYLFGLFDIAKSALSASQTALSVTGNNIANVNTPGFSRQEVVLDVSPAVTVQGHSLGTGVSVSGIKRYYDDFIQSQLLWQDLSTDPASQTQRTVLLQKANALVIAARRMEGGITDSLNGINNQVSSIAGNINSIATQIAALNDQIAQTGGNTASGEANNLLDQRDNLMTQLAQLTDFSSYEAGDGSVNISIGMRNLVYGNRTNALSAVKDENGDNNLYLDGIDITSRISTGQLGGLIAARGSIESGQLKDLRKVVASVVKETNLLHEGGYGLDGSTGNDFFNSLQLSVKNDSSGGDMTASITDLSQVTLDGYDVTFDSSGNYHVLDKDKGTEVATGAYVSGSPIAFDGIQVSISGTVTATDRFSVSPLTDAISGFGVAVSEAGKIAAAGSASSLPGDNSNALAIGQLSGNSISDLGGTTFTSFYTGIVSNIGAQSSAASDSLNFDNNLLSQLQDKRDSVSGVSLDEEATNLIKFQRSYEAGAKMIQVTDELLQTLLNL